MALRFLLDENLRGPLWQAIRHSNATGVDVLEAMRVGDPGAPALETPDPNLLLWAEAHGRILVSLDVISMSGHLADHLHAGHHSPGVFILRPRWTIPLVLAALILRDQAGDPQIYVDRFEFIP
jgi:hypothetical protein